MARAAKTGTCAVCGRDGPLSFEHVPPRKAFNERRVFQANARWMLEQARTIEEFRNPPGSYAQKGAGGHTLCQRCNNDTGSWYAAAYVDWATQAAERFTAREDAGELNVSLEVSPLRVLKQVVCMFASACGPTLFAEHTQLRKFVLDRYEQALPPDISVFAFAISTASTSTRQSGVSAVLDASLGGAETQCFSEIAFPPFGYLLMLGTAPADRALLDITPFSAFQYGETGKALHLTLPVRHVSSPFPADFRARDQIAVDAHRSRSIFPPD